MASPGTPSPSRLVASTRSARQAPSSRSARSAAAPMRCSQLSTRSSRSFSRRKSVTTSISGWPGESGIAERPGDLRQHEARVAAGARAPPATSRRRSGRRRSPATWSMRRVLPVPPTPTSETRRFAASSAPISATSRSRPMNDVSWAGRFDGALPERSGGKSDGRPGRDELVHVLRPAQVLEAMVAPVEQRRRRAAGRPRASRRPPPRRGPGRRGRSPAGARRG